MRENLLMNKNGPNQDFGPLYLFNQDQQTKRNSTFLYQFGYDKYDKDTQNFTNIHFHPQKRILEPGGVMMTDKQFKIVFYVGK